MINISTFTGGNSDICEKWRKEYLPEFCTTSVEIFDPETLVWSEGPSLSNALCGAGDYLILTVQMLTQLWK